MSRNLSPSRRSVTTYYSPDRGSPVVVASPVAVINVMTVAPPSPVGFEVFGGEGQFRYSESPVRAGDGGERGSAKQRRKHLTLLSHKVSQPCRAVNILIDYLKLKAEVQWVDILNGEHKTEAMLKINPEGVLPALVEDYGGFTLNESSAILQYLGKGSPVIPDPLHEQACVKLDEYISYHHDQVVKLSSEVFRKIIFASSPDRPQVTSDALPVLTPILETLEARLSTTTHAAGNSLSIADFLLTPNIDQLVVLSLVSSLKYPSIHRYLASMRRVPAYVKSYEAAKEQIMQILGL